MSDRINRIIFQRIEQYAPDDSICVRQNLACKQIGLPFKNILHFYVYLIHLLCQLRLSICHVIYTNVKYKRTDALSLWHQQ